MNTSSETTATPPPAVVPSVQQTRRITCDWFRSPPTDYLSVSSVVYPRGAKVTLQELDENNALVNVLYYRDDARRYLPRARLKEDAVISLSVYSSELENADDESVSFDMIQIHGKALIDAIRPALASVHYEISELVDDQIKLFNPFPELFFAQGRILETLKHGGLGTAKDKLLRALVTVMKVVLKKTNHTVRELAGQRTIDYVHLWTLFPLGSFVAHEVEHTTHLFQTLNAYVDPTAPTDNKTIQKKEKPQLVFEFASYGFDGYNWGMFQDVWRVEKFGGQISVSSLGYRPLKFEERHVDALISKKAIEKGRKSLDYQSHHYCRYVGKVFSMTQREGLEQVEIDGRVVVDCLKARTHALDWWTFYCHSEPKICPVPAKRQEVFSAMRSLCIKSNGKRPTLADQEKRKQFFNAHDEYLMLLKPLVPGWSLDYNDWFWLDVSNVEPITFEANPFRRLVIENERSISLINKLIDTKLQSIQNSQLPPKKCSQRKSLLIQFSGEAGTGKTATTTAIAEHHQRPLMRVSLGDLPLGSKEAKKMFAVVLELAQDWQAILAIDTATSFFETKKQAFGHDLARMVENFGGIGIFVKHDKERLLDDLVKQCQINLQFEPFTQQRRQKIWQLLVDREREHASDDTSKMSLLDAEMLQKMSSWELNGHDIRHLFDNILLLQQANGDESLKLEDVEDLKAITCQASGPAKGEKLDQTN